MPFEVAIVQSEHRRHRGVRNQRSGLGLRRGHVPRFAGPKRTKSIDRDPMFAQRCIQCEQGTLNTLVGQLERAPVVPGRPARACQLEAAHGLVGVHVLVLHEPAGLVGADGQDGEPRRPVLPTDGGELRLVEAGIADMIDGPAGALEHQRSPIAPAAGRTRRAPTSAAPARNGR